MARKKTAVKKKTPKKKAPAKSTAKKKTAKATVKKKTAKKKAPKKAVKKKAATKAVKKKAAKKAAKKKTIVKKKVVKKKAPKKAVKKKAATKAPHKKASAATKKKAAPAKKSAGKTKKAPVAAVPSAGKIVIPVDEQCQLPKAEVVGVWDAMLNQTNIGANNNKFYIIQLVKGGSKYHAWTRWGRVGETGQSALLGDGSLADAEKNFHAKFRAKTKNAWDDRANFVAKKGKYALIEIERSAEAAQKAEDVEEKLRSLDKEAATLQPKQKKFAVSKLHPSLERFMSLIFDHSMFKGAMASFDIDVKKMPLGQLKKSQVQKGYEVLEDLETAIESNRRQRILDLSSRFYTTIPHAFGRNVPPPIDTSDLLQKKFDMLNVLNDIEIALGLQQTETKVDKKDLLPNPADANYKKVKADLEWVDDGTDEHAMINTYMTKTASSYCRLKLVDAFRVNRHGEGDRFAAHGKFAERKLLWHGTNVAVVAAILGSGLRIMPHSGGRVGRGIYLASENGKSVGYVGWSGKTGVMFLAEAALGREHTITQDNWKLKAAPSGHECIVARGQTEPDPKDDIDWEFDGNQVVVPQGKPISRSKFKKSNFSQSEYLVYKESQARLRYVLRVTR
ncbi:MAG: WGR domain-containing protein [Planctomycetales bacterium]